ncbi:MAG: hypothetical protein MJ244_04775 [Clostridia bacterium]|nr:hypothetical protein [Clostridia bacterium]
MKILFTTNDKSKKDFYETGFKLKSKDIKFVSINDPSISDKVKFEVKNDGSIDDAISFSNNLDMVTVSVNESLYIEGLSEDNQPGANYKMVSVLNSDGIMESKELSDSEAVSYYANIVEGLGGTASAKLIDNVNICYKGNVIKSFDVTKDAVLTSNASKVIKKGYPLNSITLIPEFGDIHYSECDENEEELLFETRDKNVLKKIAKEIEDIDIINNELDNTKDFLNNEVSND